MTRAALDTESEFAALLDKWVPPHESYLAASVRRIAGQWVSLAGASAEGDDALMEPLVVSWLTDPDPRLGLGSLLLTALRSEDQTAAMAVYADGDGAVELPGLGRLVGHDPGEDLAISWRGGDRVLVRRLRRASEAEGVLQPISLIPNTRAVLAARIHPLLERFYVGVGPEGGTPRVDAPSHDHSEAVADAFSLIAGAIPLLHPYWRRAIRRVTLHAAGTVNSFATPAAQGAVFLAVSDGDSEIGIAEDLVHQGGHVLCTTITVDREAFFATDPNIPFAAVSGSGQDERSLYEVFHGVFTGGVMVVLLHRMLDLDAISARQAHEALGRLAFIASRSVADLADLCRPGLLTDEGVRVMATCRNAVSDAVGRRGAQLATVDLVGQPYAFSYEAFAHRNPRHVARAR